MLNQVVATAEGLDAGVPAFIDLDGTHTSYDRFSARVRGLATGIADLEPRAGGAFGILALNSRAYVELLFAAAWGGRVAVPLNVRWSASELAYAIDDAGIEVLFVDEAMQSTVERIREKTHRLRHVVAIGHPAVGDPAGSLEALAASRPAAASPAAADTPVAVIYTGGTTGASRGAVHTQASLFASGLNCVCMGGIPRESRCLLVLPLFHSGAIGLAIAQLLQRGTIVVGPMFRPDILRQAVTELGADALAFVPTMLGMLLDDPGFDPADYRGVRGVTYGASPMPAALLQRVLAAFPAAAISQIYGMTEVGIAIVLSDRWHRGPGARPDAAGQPGPLYRVRIVDAQGRDLPRGQLGEVTFQGPGLMQGYLNKPGETAAVLDAGGLRSGDAGIMDEQGIVTLLDRVKDMIVTGGENVYSVEVENAISMHPAVAQCAVVGAPDDAYGERVHAVVVLKPGAALELEQLRQHCASRIAGYKCPRSLEIRDAMPLSPMGKILKTTLRQSLWTGRSRSIG